MRNGVAFQKQSEEAFVTEHRQRLKKSLRRCAQEMGYELKKFETPEPEQLTAV